MAKQDRFSVVLEV